MNKLKQNDIKTRDSTLKEIESLNLSKLNSFLSFLNNHLKRFTGEISNIIAETVIQQKDLIYFMTVYNIICTSKSYLFIYFLVFLDFAPNI